MGEKEKEKSGKPVKAKRQGRERERERGEARRTASHDAYEVARSRSVSLEANDSFCSSVVSAITFTTNAAPTPTTNNDGDTSSLSFCKSLKVFFLLSPSEKWFPRNDHPLRTK